MSLLQQQAELRKALSQIIHELRQPLPVYCHQIKQLKGKGYYIFLPWEAYREKLDTVAPDYEVRFYDFTVNIELNLAILYCEIKILGVAKSEIGAVPISELSGSGNEMTRGNSLDRAHAESFKNAAEAWGVGAYISDQYYAYKLIERQKYLVSESMRDQLNRVQAHLQSQEKSGELKSVSKIKAANGLDMGLPALPEKESEAKKIVQASVAGAIAAVRNKTAIAPSKTEVAPQSAGLRQPLEIVAPPMHLREAPATIPGLYPQHETLMKEFSAEFAFDTVVDFIRKAITQGCPGKEVVADLQPDQIITLMAQVAAAWAHAKGLYESRQNALNVIKSKIEFLKASSGGTIPVGAAKQLCLDWRQSLLMPVNK